MEDCLKSIRPYVKEIIVVDTGSTDGTLEIVKRYADKWEVFTDCNDEEGIFDFSMARNRSFELASYPTTMWMDSDDVLIGGENIIKYYEKYKDIDHPYFIQFPYHYSFDTAGKCNLIHYRERIFFNSQHFRWQSPVHEVRIPKPDTNQQFGCEVAEDIIWRHNRQFVQKTIQPNRNLRILKKWYDQHGDSDARQLYYLGLEYGNVGDLENSKKMLNRYLELSGWDDEKYMALLRLMDYDFYHADYKGAVDHAMEALKIKEDWGEAYFNCAKAHYFLANSGVEPEKNWNKCINFAQIGLALPPTRTLLFVNPNERNVEIHRYLNLAYNKTGKIQDALKSVNMGLEHDPGHAELLGNKKIYEDYLRRSSIAAGIEELCTIGGISIENKELIFKLLTTGTIEGPKDIKSPDKKEEKVPEVSSGGSSINWKEYYRSPEYPRGAKVEDQPVAVITPHPQAFGIPETFVYEDLPLKMTDAQLQVLVNTIWKEMLLGDELISCIKFLENAPCRVRDSVETDSLLKKTQKMISWINDPVLYDRDNTPIDIGTEKPLAGEMCPLPQPLPTQGQARLQWMTDRMPNKTESVLDLGCIDGECSNRLGLAGYQEVVGVDICTHSIKMANEAAARHNTGVKHIQSYFKEAPAKLEGKKFDNIICMDVIEHLIDPVEDAFKPARKMVKEDGKMLVGVPFRAWFQNQIAMQAHPWLYGDLKGMAWNDENHNRAHIRAPSVWSMAKYAREAGWYVKTSNYVAQWAQDVPNQGNVNLELLPNAPKGKYESKDIVFFMGDGLETITPSIIDISGMGGSELALREMSKRFAAEGHRVRVYAGCGALGEGIYEGVEWYQTGKYRDLSCDVLIASRQADALADDLHIKAKLRCLWVHDIYPKGFTPEYAEKSDIIFALTHWHKQFMLERFHFLKSEKIVVTGNGLDFDRFDRQLETRRDPHKMFVSSSPDRYLASMLKIFPKVKARVPDATLNIAYGFFNWRKTAELMNDQGQLRLIDELEREVKKLEPMGVQMLGRINQFDLAREFLSAGVWTLPSHFTETNCIGLTEALAGGCAVVSSNNAALGERILPELGVKIDGDWLSDKYINEFTDAVVKAMLETTDEQRMRNIKYARENLSWNKFAGDWQDLFMSKLKSGAVIADNIRSDSSSDFTYGSTIHLGKKEFTLKKYVPVSDR